MVRLAPAPTRQFQECLIAQDNHDGHHQEKEELLNRDFWKHVDINDLMVIKEPALLGNGPGIPAEVNR